MIVKRDVYDELTVYLERAKSGDQDSFRMIYNLISGKMYSLCLRYAGNTEDANDLFQEGFFKLYRSLEDYKGHGSFEGWARRIFVTTCLDFLRKNRIRTVELEESIPIETVDLSGLDTLVMKDLMQLIQKLPEGYRTVFNLYLVEGYSHKEIGTMIGIAESGSKSQLHRAKLYLKKLLLNEGKQEQYVCPT